MCLVALLPVLLSSILLMSGTQATKSLLRQRHRQRRPPPSPPSCTSTCPDPACASPTCGGLRNICGSSCEEVDILIIGAGAAGLGASQEIEKYNKEHPGTAKTYKVIEEYSEAGGRMKDVHWIHGGEGNPFSEFLWEQGQRGCHELEYDVQKWRDIKYYKFVGFSVEEVSKQESNQLNGDFKDIYNCVVDQANAFWPLPYIETAPVDIGLGEAINNCSKTLDIATNINLEWIRFDFEFSQRPSVTSMYGLPEDTYDDFQDRTDWFLSDPCYGPEEIAKREFDHNCITECIDFNTKVLKVAWNDTWPLRVTVKNTTDHTEKTYQTRQVISTVSVGLLAANQGMFEPPLRNVTTKKAGNVTSNKFDDMNAVFQMGLYYEVLFQLGDKFWKNVDDDFEFINIDFRDSNKLGHCDWWQVYDTKWNNEFYPGSQMVSCTLTTETIEKLGISDDNSEIDQVISDLLRDSLGHVVDFVHTSDNCTRCNPEDCDIFDGAIPGDGECRYRFYDHNKTARYGGGSYENWQVGGERLQLENFQAPLININGTQVVHIAGSAACFNFWGYIHGAFYSGIRAANAALEALGVQENDLPNSPQFCEESPTGGLGNLMLPRAGG